jgi:hypothetical protein
MIGQFTQNLVLRLNYGCAGNRQTGSRSDPRDGPGNQVRRSQGRRARNPATTRDCGLVRSLRTRRTEGNPCHVGVIPGVFFGVISVFPKKTNTFCKSWCPPMRAVAIGFVPWCCQNDTGVKLAGGIRPSCPYFSTSRLFIARSSLT